MFAGMVGEYHERRAGASPQIEVGAMQVVHSIEPVIGYKFHLFINEIGEIFVSDSIEMLEPIPNH